ncbi:hypothetical protein [uncultured Fibrobacter sp.]|uniref:hypothetical protein n=1 Tax=uncultured Fibrobacter sp. TaxID=261512 RepID=UPI00261062CA|nr:hypothetical protein [uncultured Fibrobacter sp.]
MKKRVILLSAMALAMTGCLEPTARSMGSTLMPAPLTHRAPSDTASPQEISVAATGFWGHTSDAYNVTDLNAGGGSLGLTYRFDGKMSPFFVNAAVGGFGGSLKFGCDEDADCNKTVAENDPMLYSPNHPDYAYVVWLDSDAGKKSYGFWNVQERLLTGADLSTSTVIVGFAAGLQFYQGASDYDDVREELSDKKWVNDIDEKQGMGFMTAWWFGFHFGHKGSLGDAVVEYDVLHKGELANWTTSLKLTYTHPTGFFVGGASSSLIEWAVYAGKNFVF